MKDLKQCTEEELIELIKMKKVNAGDLIDANICPTCFDRSHDHVLYGDNAHLIYYEDDLFECFLADNPRSHGHTIINTKKHYKDMMEVDDDTCQKIFVLAKKAMNVLKEVYQSESVYLCTMCDGPMNHFHVQLIPRYNYEKRGSKNFVKERFKYQEDLEKLYQLRKRMKDEIQTY